MEFDFPPQPSVPDQLTLASLAAIRDEDVDQVLLLYALQRVESELSYDAPDFRALPLGLRAHLVSMIVDGEVCNGGFNQLFFNSSGQLVPAAPEIFEWLGLPDVADLMREALQVYTQRANLLDEAREEGSLEAFSATYEDDPFAPLDDRYYAIEETIRAARLKRVRSTPADYVESRTTPPNGR